MTNKESKPLLPENAYTELAEGEEYKPIIPETEKPLELTFRSVFWGILLCVIFTVASAYSGLKVGQVMDAAIPISIIAIGLARIYRRKSTILENMILTGIGGTSGSIVAGAIFTIPAFYALGISPHPIQSMFICLAGGVLGVLFLIPLRRYFVKETHGQLPYPEATAITEVLVTGEQGGSQVKLLLKATAIAGIYDFFITTFHMWKETIDFQFIPLFRTIGDKAKMIVSFDAVAFILGLGYVMGLRSSMILCAGSILANLVLVPLVFFIGANFPDLVVYPGKMAIADMDAHQIFSSYVRLIGVGAIASAGIFGIVKSMKIILGSFAIAAKAFKQKKHKDAVRTDIDFNIVTILIGVVISALAIAIFLGKLNVSFGVALLGLALTLGFSFFFTTVAANAIATTARNPVSGMTMLTIIVSCVVLLKFGLSGTSGMFFVMVIAGMVCTAISTSGQFITDLKAGYWIGSTPKILQHVKLYGVVFASIAVAFTILMLSKSYQFGDAVPGDPRAVLPAPQAAIMKQLVETFMSHQPITYLLFGIGFMITIVLEMLGVPAIIFALGMYLPLELNSPALIGGFISYLVIRKADKTKGKRGRAMKERGVIIASGFLAGGALGGVIGAAMRLIPGYRTDLIQMPFYNIDSISQSVSILFFVALCVYLFWESVRNYKKS